MAAMNSSVISRKYLQLIPLAAILLSSSGKAESPYEASLSENILSIPYILVGDQAYYATFKQAKDNCPSACFKLQTAELREKVLPAINAPFFDDSIIRLPRLRVSGEIYSVDFSVVDGETIFLSNYQALTNERSFPLSTSITSRHGHGEKWGFEGSMVNMLQGGTSPLLVKSFFSMSVCTDEDSIGCYKQPPPISL